MRWCSVNYPKTCSDSAVGRLKRSLALGNVRSGLMLSKKSPQRSCEIEMRNDRIAQVKFVNQCCPFETDLESILLAGSRKNLFRQYRPIGDMAALCVLNPSRLVNGKISGFGDWVCAQELPSNHHIALQTVSLMQVA
jgi:hypothetical protein